ncbi:monovalent cation/H(+) antiporter subunit G [Clostridium ganghwense]|uniref:Monovalent cation/H(+) antiporter subunit G n=1 Tax=Clostridium ganghwense TaxID=312089 RepID=A0ABT4CSM9_9CLOT|nr:monovalent cation/H(+) antiporter subunit G [Clostridium ganghwense]MCY6372054.1 monovalent cation/H(+) antiporter subunit G [Clostridium ganghwense]
MKTIIVGIFLMGGLFFFMVGTVGILRFPDIYTRAHSAAKCDTLGAILSLTALIIYNGLNIVSLKLLLIIVFIWITNPTATHLIVKVKHENDKKEKLKDGVSENESI